MKFLTIDFSINNTGIAIYDTETGIIETHLFEILSKGFVRNMDIANYFLRLCRKENITAVMLEGYAIRGKNKYKHLIIEATGILKQTLVQEGIDLYAIPPTSVKKIISGNGRAEKPEVAAALSNKYGVTFKTFDESDAYAIMKILLNYFDIEKDLDFDKSVVEVLYLNEDFKIK